MPGQNKLLTLINPIKDLGKVGLGFSRCNCVHKGMNDLLQVILP